MDYLPIFADLKAQPCLIAGAGSVARRKLELLLEAGAAVTLVAPEVDPATRELATANNVALIERTFSDADIVGKLLVIAATNDAAVNQHIAALCAAQQTLCNVVDDREHSGFIMPAIVDRSPIQVAISSGGSSPVLATRIRQQLEVALPRRLGALANWAAHWRDAVSKQFADNGLDDDQRRHFWRDVLNGPIAEQVLNDATDSANQAMTKRLAGHNDAGGEAYIVGAGCGDPELLTLRAAQLLQQADVVLYDRLVAPQILAMARRDADKIAVGKEAGSKATAQDEINALLVKHVSNGKRVCRLKGGDPFIFGRGGEEIQALAAAGLSWQVVPGITAASGAASYAGIPLTHRGLARSVTIVTARDRQNGAPDWSSLVAEQNTVVLYMGVGSATEIADGLIAAGKPAETPVAVIENGTTAKQRVVRGTLGELPAVVAENQIQAPAVIVVGEVTGLADELAWFRASAETDDNSEQYAWSNAAFGHRKQK